MDPATQVESEATMQDYTEFQLTDYIPNDYILDCIKFDVIEKYIPYSASGNSRRYNCIVQYVQVIGYKILNSF